MSFFTLSDRNGHSITFNSEQVTHVADGVEEGAGVAVYLVGGGCEIVSENYLEVVGMLKGLHNGY
jgi:hypothetical protein